MRLLFIDFETRSEANLKACGAQIYSVSPTTIPLCLAYAIDDGPVKLLDKEFWDDFACLVPDDIFLAAKDPDCIFVAHNAFFEQMIWLNVLVARFGWPEVPIHRWKDTMAKLRAFSLPASLGEGAKALQLPIQKDTMGKLLLSQLCVPRKPTKTNTERWNNDPSKLEALYSYCGTDVETMRELDKKLPDLNPIEQQIWIADQEMNQYGVPVDLELAKSALVLIAEHEKTLNTRLSELTEGTVEKASQLPALKRWLHNEADIEVDSLDKGAIVRLIEQGVSPVVAEVLFIRQQLGRSSTKKYQRFLTMTDKTVKRSMGALEYHRTRTGRWGGRGIQLHNLPRGNAKVGHVSKADTMETLVRLVKERDLDLLDMMFDDVSEVLSSVIRGAVVSEKGYDLIAADYGQIEARTLLWLADEQEGLDLFRTGQDAYLNMAKTIFSNPHLTKENSFERQLGKATILGAGYQLGWKRFKAQAALAPYFLDLDEDMAKLAIRSYRSTYPKVQQLWYDMNEAARTAIREQRTVPCGKVKFGIRGNFLLMRLPSGRMLSYPYPQLMKKKYTEAQVQKLIEDGEQWKIDKTLVTFMAEENNQWCRTSTYGGNLVADLTQATARDIMANGLLNVRADDAYQNLLTIHDELITQVKEGEGSVEEVCALMCKLPEWAKGNPIIAEGWRGKRYHK